MTDNPRLLAACNAATLPRACADLAPVGGRIKVQPEDFLVEEVPAYEPSGEGDFLYLRIEKRDMAGEDLLRLVSRELGISRGEIGQAGIKDRYAVTRQWLSVPAVAEARVSHLEGPSIRVLATARHTNKLKTGHLRGNAFTVVIRDVGPDASARAQAVVDRLNRGGMPNWFGPQRFGSDGRTGLVGLDLLRGLRTRETRQVAFDRFRKRLALSAAQSILFNATLARRMEDHGLGRVLEGELLAKTDTGGVFLSTERDVDQARLDAGEVVHTGPIFGKKMRHPDGEAGALEQSILDLAGLPADAWSKHGKLTLGTRRLNIIRPRGLAVETIDEGLRLTFELPKGSYATVLLRELTGDALPAGEDDAEQEGDEE